MANGNGNGGELEVDAGPLKVRTKNYRLMDLVLIVAFALAAVGAYFVWRHEETSGLFQVQMVKAINDNTAALRFQACLLAIDQKERIGQLRKGSACWYMGRGYEYEDLGPERPR